MQIKHYRVLAELTSDVNCWKSVEVYARGEAKARKYAIDEFHQDGYEVVTIISVKEIP